MQHKESPGFSIFTPGDLHTINLEDFPPSATVPTFLSRSDFIKDKILEK